MSRPVVMWIVVILIGQGRSHRFDAVLRIVDARSHRPVEIGPGRRRPLRSRFMAP
jgi:hypothetical protein